MAFYTIKELPESDRPREKLIKLGAENLSDSELLAIILRTGSKERNALELARELLKHFGGLSGLSRAHLEELLSFKGLGKAKAVTLIAAIELGQRCLAGEKIPPKISSPEDVAKLLLPKYSGLKVEVFGIVTLNSKGKLISVHEVSKGGVNFTSVTPKEVFHPAVKDLASAVILFHNHPSGEVTPSREDIVVTERLIKAGKHLEIEVLDHIIFGSSQFLSFKKEGLL
ncbi:RadC family protein [Phorcysia thermohydrogeniphila]|uniref:DNA replication and repair protein RadC n=1 Tax=Phorcysia thermohydrogeniphila TaxID=936138 RepID=A0A4R1GB95_9BACT|nr:DNA repair protein RadC [Phorcysia thermohydrogeniphila]TCK05254.1 DNA replication and repair protein RadC [Phorcysia thermohydrogeniphila]